MVFVFLNTCILIAIAFIFVLDLTLYTLFLAFLIYIFIFFYFLCVGAEVIALLLLLVYLGGVLIIFIFSLHFTDFRKVKPLYRYRGFYSDLFNRLSIFFLFFLGPICLSTYSQAYDLLFFAQIVGYSQHDKALLIEYLTIFFTYKKLYPPVVTFADLSFFYVGVKLYGEFWMGCFLLFLLFIVALLTLMCLPSISMSMGHHFFVKKLVILDQESGKSSTFYHTFPQKFFFGYSEKLVTSMFLFDIGWSNYCYIWYFSDWILIVLFFSFFFVLMSCFFFKNFNFLKFLIISEIFVAIAALTLVCYSYIHYNVDGIVLSLFLVGIFAAETAVGLAIFNIANSNAQVFRKRRLKNEF